MTFLRYFTLLLLFVAAGTPASAGKKKDKDRYTIEQLQTREVTVELHAEANEMIDEMESDLAKAEAEDDEGDIDDIEDVLEVVEYAEQWLSRALADGVAPKDRFSANLYSDRILQTVKKPVEGEDLPPLDQAIDNVFVFGIFGQPMKNLSVSRQNKQLGSRAAKKESVNLWSSGRDSFYSPSELSKMTPAEVANLDVDPKNPTWYDRETFAKLKPNRIHDFEAFVATGMTNALREDGDLKNNETYDLNSSRKVLFMEEVYLSATSPKCITEDAFGVEWKLKWADEVAVEPVASRLYLLAGAKMTDSVYTNGFGPDDMILVLMDEDDAGDKKTKEDKRYPVTVSDLKDHLSEFYTFDLEPYIHSYGTVTEANVNDLLKNLPSNGKEKYQKSKMIGRTWVSFRESSVELKTKGFVRRHDGSRLSDVLAVNDRTVRGSYLFDMWIANRDVKDDNNKAFFLKTPQGGTNMEISEYREGHHDLGLSLGSLWSSGEVNRFETDLSFAKKGLFGKLLFKQAVVFRPKAWDAATWADSKWMAEKLAQISNEEITEAVETSNWPDFVQDALIWRLINRRDRISELFGNPPTVIAEAPSLMVPLSTPDQIADAASYYGVPAEELAATASGDELVLDRGKIASCKNSALVRLLVKHRYPSGLDTRYERKGSKKPKCTE